MTYFRPDGHLDEAAFPALEHGEADSLARLEAAEHLSFCDACIDRYAAYLEGAELLCPEEPLPLPVAREAKALGLTSGELAELTARAYDEKE